MKKTRQVVDLSILVQILFAFIKSDLVVHRYIGTYSLCKGYFWCKVYSWYIGNSLNIGYSLVNRLLFVHR